MRLRLAPLVVLLGLLGLLGACSSGPRATLPAPTASPAGPRGDLSAAQLSARLLQPADLPDLPTRRPYASATLTTQAPPQLALCHAATPTAPHALANVLAQGSSTGQVQVFEVLSVYADPAGAAGAYAQALADARACSSYTFQGRPFTVTDLAEVPVPGGAQATHYRLTTPDVVGGDVRTLAVQGRYAVLITGYGAPPAGQSLLDYQAAVLQQALARLA